MSYDVLIAGAGPAGSACGTILAKAGLKVAICDRANFPRQKICGDCINPRAWSLFDCLGVADEIRALPLRRIRHMNVTNVGGSTCAAKIAAHPERPLFAVGRQHLDHLLLQCAERAGVAVYLGTRVVDATWDGRWLVRGAKCHSGRSFSLSVKFLIAADGRNSTIARRYSEVVRPSASRLRGGVQWQTRAQPIGDSVAMFLFDSGYAGVVNLDEASANIAIAVAMEAAHNAKRNLDDFIARTLMRNSRARDMLQDVRPTGPVHTAFPIDPTTRKIQGQKNLALVGDARRTFEPFTGEGVYFALQDGITTGARVARLLGKSCSVQVPTRQQLISWANSVCSPILKNPRLSEASVAIGSRFPSLVPVAVKTIF